MRAWRTAAVFGVLVLVAVAFGLGVLVTRDDKDQKAPRRTEVVRVSPFGGSGSLRAGYEIAGTKDGSCDLPSEIVAGAFRCFSGDSIDDACWRDDSQEDRALCLRSPTSKRAFAINTRRPLRSPPATGHFPPWHLVLSSGEDCTFITGAGSTSGDKRVNYQCKAGSGGLNLVGTPTRYADHLWRIGAARQQGTKYSPEERPREIERAYYGTYRR